jgi:LysR family transcriptional regulator, regulator for bpeEF and oprC
MLNKLLAMEVFVRVVETGGITRAAERLALPKASVTTLLQKLEATLGVKLLHRTTRRVSTTADGAAYYERCVGILASIQDTEESLAKRRALPRGRLRVDVPTLMARSVLVPALPDLFARYPEIELALACNERRADLIEEGIDCAVWSGEIEDATLVARRVGYLYFATCAAPAYLAARGAPQHPLDLERHRCINRFVPGTGAVAAWTFSRDDERVEAVFPGHVALEDENSYVAAAEAGLGIAQIPAFIAKDAIERGVLELVLGDWFPEPAPLYIAYPQNRHLSNKVRVFVDWVAELLRQHDGIQLRSTLAGGLRPIGDAL